MPPRFRGRSKQSHWQHESRKSRRRAACFPNTFLHTKITEATGLPIYFCDPHIPWQRGTSENTNGLFRQYFSKATDLSFHGPGILDNVAAELNARPANATAGRTPAEELHRLLSDPSAYVAATDLNPRSAACAPY
jgi:hypothetical protein